MPLINSKILFTVFKFALLTLVSNSSFIYYSSEIDFFSLQILERIPNSDLSIEDNSIQINFRDQEKINDSLNSPNVETDTLVVKENKRTVYIDSEGFTVKNGDRIFPLGVFMGSSGSTDNENLSRISEAGFNTILCYGYGTGPHQERFLNRAADNGLHVVYSLKDKYPKNRNGNMDYFLRATETQVKRLRNHDALLAWYINDEMGTSWIPLISQLYNKVKEHDQNHPTLQVLYQEDILAQYRDITDILAMDSYNIGAEDLTQSSRRARLSMDAMRGENNENIKKGVWQVPQIYDKSVYHADRESRIPTRDEIKTQTYQAIIEGARGIIFYSYHDLFREKNKKGKINDQEHFNKRLDDIKLAVSDIKSLVDLVLVGEIRKDFIKIRESQDVKDLTIFYNENIYLVISNPFYDERNITIEVPSQYMVDDFIQGEIRMKQDGDIVKLKIPATYSGIVKFIKKD
ncbi:hypothetical protein ACFSKL_18480 [Belliella marina]|uniref:Glycoside hydrolase family 42 N-terminal domain-containing protein n=1 Tax=Belliella marina TaxID=1644146 RepID=A0ABW4VPU8_9BACT